MSIHAAVQPTFFLKKRWLIENIMAETVALIVAAGRGERAQGPAAAPPKQYWPLAGKAVLRWAAETFASHPLISSVQIVIADADRQYYEAATSRLRLRPPVIGGPTRQHSVRHGLEALSETATQNVLIHDGARPFVSAALITRVIGALESADAAVPMLPVADTLRRKTADGFRIEPRDDLLRAQTPQGFRFSSILTAHRTFLEMNATDDFALAERAGLLLATVPGEEVNLKLTTRDDFILAERIASESLCDIRTGTGFDVHRFAAGDHVWLCGVKIPHGFGLEGHSDADCGLHALTDAILGAIGAADIGVHFPPTDERWRGAPSHVFLAHAASLVRDKGGIIAHVDVTLICEQPKIAPHREAMRARIAEILALDIERVSVKATTTEGLGFAGRREGIAAQAVATIRLP
jgi:2-C-methyl-D-erythritol 4-phosphate cytidylyltransferase/2-C-methyl-D-erythritol 2,4-cyclodiphosphate synthase